MATVRVALSDVRISYAHGLWEKTEYEDGEAKFKIKLGLPHGGKQFVEVQKAIEKIAKEEWGTNSGAVLKSLNNNIQKFCWIDGDNSPDKEGYAGNMILGASSKVRPTVVAADGKTPVAKEDGTIYSGCYGNALVEFRTMDHNKFGKGVFCTIRGFQFFRDGDSFSGAPPPAAENEFSDLSTEGDDPTA